MNPSLLAPFLDRRARVAQRMRQAGGGIAVLWAAAPALRSRDTHHPYRQDSYFHYLTGFDEPEACLLLRDDGHSLLFCRSRDDAQEIWQGKRVGPLAAPTRLGVSQAQAINTLDTDLPLRLEAHPAVWTLFDAPGMPDARLPPSRATPHGQRDLTPLLDDMRLVKDASELATMRRAAAISAQAHARAMRHCARRLHADPTAALPEYEIEAELLHEFRRHGAQSPAYETIVAAGANACVLHYAAGKGELRAGDLCLIDAGCELDGYASDITRTFPATGRFSGPQRELYDIVLAAQAAAQAATRPGARQRDAHHAAVRVLSQGMLDTGLLDRERVGSVDDVIDSAAYRQFYMHGTGHWLGRDVHDVGDYLAQNEPESEQPDGLGGRALKKPSRVLRPGMVVTLEPGLYVRPAPGVPPHYWHTGIRIEDDAVLTATGCELISRGVPVRADEIEAWMRDL